MLKLLPDMVRLDNEEMASMSSFCGFINENKDSLSDYQKDVVSEYIISNICGVRKEKVNKGIYDFLRSYLCSNIGDISFNLYGNSIREITLGNIKAGPLFSSNFTNQELSDRYLSGKNSCGVIPSRDNMKKLFVCYGDKNINSDDIGHSDNDYKNVHIGEYYFNTDNILKDEVSPYVFRFTSIYDNELQIDVLSFDKDGNIIDDDIYIDYLESSDGINYKVVKQVHNELEDINNLHSRGK